MLAIDVDVIITHYSIARLHYTADKRCGVVNHKSNNKGLISADRSNKATLPLTIPR